MKISPFPIAIATALLAGGCDSIIDFEVDEPKLCSIAVGESFPGAPMIPVGPVPKSEQPVALDFNRPLQQIPGVLVDKKFNFDARFNEMTLDGKNTDIGFIRTVEISLEPPPSMQGLPELPLASLNRSPSPGVTKLSVPVVPTSNVFQYLVNQPAQLHFVITGDLPPQAFILDIEGCIKVKGRAKLP